MRGDAAATNGVVWVGGWVQGCGVRWGVEWATRLVMVGRRCRTVWSVRSVVRGKGGQNTHPSSSLNCAFVSRCRCLASKLSKNSVSKLSATTTCGEPGECVGGGVGNKGGGGGGGGKNTGRGGGGGGGERGGGGGEGLRKNRCRMVGRGAAAHQVHHVRQYRYSRALQ